MPRVDVSTVEGDNTSHLLDEEPLCRLDAQNRVDRVHIITDRSLRVNTLGGENVEEPLHRDPRRYLSALNIHHPLVSTRLFPRVHLGDACDTRDADGLDVLDRHIATGEKVHILLGEKRGAFGFEICLFKIDLTVGTLGAVVFGFRLRGL